MCWSETTAMSSQAHWRKCSPVESKTDRFQDKAVWVLRATKLVCLTNWPSLGRISCMWPADHLGDFSLGNGRVPLLGHSPLRNKHIWSLVAATTEMFSTATLNGPNPRWEAGIEKPAENPLSPAKCTATNNNLRLKENHFVAVMKKSLRSLWKQMSAWASAAACFTVAPLPRSKAALLGRDNIETAVPRWIPSVMAAASLQAPS